MIQVEQVAQHLQELAKAFHCAAVTLTASEARVFWPAWCNEMLNLAALLTPQERAEVLARIGIEDVNTLRKS